MLGEKYHTERVFLADFLERVRIKREDEVQGLG